MNLKKNVKVLSDYLVGRRIRSIELTSNGWRMYLDDGGEVHLVAIVGIHSNDWQRPEFLSPTRPANQDRLESLRDQTISEVALEVAGKSLRIGLESSEKHLTLDLDDSLLENLVAFPPQLDGFIAL